MNSDNRFQPNELIITTGGGKVQSAGFTIFNRFLSNKVQPMYTINKDEFKTRPIDKVSSLFDGFVVPIGLHVSHPYDRKKEDYDTCDNSYENANVIEEDLYDALLTLTGQHKLVENTRKHIHKSKSKNTKRMENSEKKTKTKKIKKDAK